MFVFATTTVFASCSEDDPDTDNTETPENNPEDNPETPDDGHHGIPDEYLTKIKAIYSAANTDPQEIKTISRLAILSSISSTINGCGPISATPATLNGEDITLVTLGGVQDVEGQATTIKESQLAAFGKPNDYLTAVTNLFTNGTIPADKPVMIAGYSLGGMIAQQVAGVREITDNFKIKAITTFGSPITLPLDRKGIKVIRYTDINDGVPQLGETVIRNGLVTVDNMTKEEMTAAINELDEKERIVRESKYTDMLITHALSYIEDECWNDIDFLGDPNKQNILVLKEKMSFYHAPKSY